MQAAAEVFPVVRGRERRDVRLLTFASKPTDVFGSVLVARQALGQGCSDPITAKTIPSALDRPNELPCRIAGGVGASYQGIETEKSGCGIRVAHRCRRGVCATGSSHGRSAAQPPPRTAQSASSRVVDGSSRRHLAWTGLAVLSAGLLFVGLDTTILNALPLPDQLGAEGSTLRWIERAEAIASWSWTATVEIGLLGSELLTMIPLSIPSFSSPSASAALSILRSW